MRAALQCVLIALITTHIQENKAVEDDDFRPTPIPLDYWNDRRSGRAGTSHQMNKTDPSPTVAAAPAHYWEDALRHSVYLTLVRDKIDQLIASGAIVSPDNKPDYASKEVDDHDLWEKIKTAPFERLTNEDHTVFGDVTVMARGRLMNENNGFRFAEDKASKEKCSDERCMEGVKALWSVKRMRQRDPGAPPGKYHYDLTFSVTSQSPRTQRKPYENPVRTFTVRENPPEEPQRVYDISHKQRPQRAIWFHKNIVPTKHHHSQYNQGLDRIFSSFFSDEESYVETPRYKQQSPYVPQMYPQHSKTGYVNGQVPTPESHHQKRLMPYNYKPQQFKYSRPPLAAPPLSHVQPYIDFDSMANSPYPPPPPPSDHIKYQSSNVIKTTRPAVLPTPLMPVTAASFQNMKNSSIDDINIILNVTDITPRESEIITGFKGSSNPKHPPLKVSYFPDHVRPPVYNAPPGVFVTMDKKPFKPMPPLKLVHSSKPMRTKPVDFRPSPQVLDAQFSDPDHLTNFAFRPITINYANSNYTDKTIVPENNKKRKPSAHNKKPLKKQETIRTQSTTTTTPDIITADSEEESDPMEWANLLGAFTKTTPMVSQKEKINKTVTEPPTTTVASTTIAMKPRIVEITTTTTTSTTTEKPKKRTRPPHKFTKPAKTKKHKRITTTTIATTTTTTTTTTTKPPEMVRKPVQDLTPQASSAATSRPSWKPKNKIITTTPMTTSSSTMITTTAKPSSTTTATTQVTTTNASTTSITNDIEQGTTQPKIKNRYRQSTLMQKGTSVKHDRWSVSGLEKNKTSVTRKYPRRKGSNFQGYVFPKRKTTESEHTREQHPDDVENDKPNQYDKNTTKVNEVPNTTTQVSETSPTPTSANSESSSAISTDLSNMEEDEEEFDEDNDESTEDNDEQEIKDHTEYIFNVTATPVMVEKNIEAEEDKLTTTEQIVTTSPYSVPKNKTKCKKKKQQNLTTTQGTEIDSNIEHEPTSSTTTTEKPSTTDSFTDFFEEFVLNDKPKKPDDKSSNISTSQPEIYEEEESESHDIYVHPKDEFQRFMDSLDRDDEDDDDGEEYDNDDDNDYSPFNNVDENSEARNSDSDYPDYQDRSYGLYEFMPMK